MGLCDKIAVLNFGKIIASGQPEAIRTNEEVIEAYLGRDDEDDAEAHAHSTGATS
jgi:branched-chain amino acid transport system ATP-binding protein